MMVTPAARLVLTAAARAALLDAAALPTALRASSTALLHAPQPTPPWRSFAAAVPTPAAGAPSQEIPAFVPAQMPPAHQHPGFPNTAYSTATLGVRGMSMLPWPVWQGV